MDILLGFILYTLDGLAVLLVYLKNCVEKLQKAILCL